MGRIPRNGSSCVLARARFVDDGRRTEALWFSYEGEAADSLVLLFEVGPLTQYQAVPFDEAMNALREVAAPLAGMSRWDNTGRDEDSVPIMGTTQCRQAGGGR